MKWLNYWNASIIGQRLYRLGAVGFFVFCLSFSLSAQHVISLSRTVEEAPAVSLVDKSNPTPSELQKMTPDELRNYISKLQSQIKSKDKLLNEWTQLWTMLKTPEKDLLDKLIVVTTSYDELKKASEKATTDHQADHEAQAQVIRDKDFIIAIKDGLLSNSTRDKVLWGFGGLIAGGASGLAIGKSIK